MKKGWKTVPMGKLCSISSGESDTQDAVADGPYAFFDRSKTIKRSTRFLYDCEALIIPGEGKEFLPKHFEGKFDLHQRAYALFDFLPDLDVRFLYHLLHHRSDYFPSVAVGATVKSLRRRHFEDLPVPVPPLAEQQRIVGLLDEAFEGLATAKANAEKNLQNARALFESLLTSAMSGKLTKEWRKSHPHVETGSALLDQILAKRRRAWSKKGEYPEPTPPSTNDSPSIPASWTWTNLSQLKTFSLYGPRFSNDDYSQTGVLVLRTTDIDEHGKVNSDTAPKLKMTEEEFDKYRCKKGDLLITRTGSLGTLAVFDDDTRAIPGAYLIQFRLGFSEVIPWFLFAFFKSPAAQALLTSGGTGAGIQNLNVPTLEAIPIPFPPLDEQREIVSQLNTLAEETQRLARLYERKHAALEALKKSLLHQAFTGEL